MFLYDGSCFVSILKSEGSLCCCSLLPVRHIWICDQNKAGGGDAMLSGHLTSRKNNHILKVVDQNKKN